MCKMFHTGASFAKLEQWEAWTLSDSSQRLCKLAALNVPVLVLSQRLSILLLLEAIFLQT